MGALAALGPLSIDMYLPGFPAIAKDLQTDIAHVGLSLTSYFIGVSVGQLLYGPIIDRYGRKKPLLIGLFLYLLAAIGCALSPTIFWLIGLRLLLALGGCVGMVAGRAIVRDLFPANETAKVFSTLILVMSVAPIIAPTLGGFVTATFGWRYIFFILTLIAAILFFLVYRFLPESRQPDASVSLKPKRVLQDYLIVLKDPQFIVFAIAGSVTFAGLFAYLSGSPFVFMGYFGLSETHYSWLFGLNAFGFILGSQLNRLWLQRKTPEQITRRAGIFQWVSGFLLAVGTVSGVLHIAATIVLIFSFLFWSGFIAPNATAISLRPFTHYAGSASALLGSVQMMAGALASGLVSSLHNNTPLPMAIIMAACATLALIALLLHRQMMKKEALATAQN